MLTELNTSALWSKTDLTCGSTYLYHFYDLFMSTKLCTKKILSLLLLTFSSMVSFRDAFIRFVCFQLYSATGVIYVAGFYIDLVALLNRA